MYHHSLLKRTLKISSILKLDSMEEQKIGHSACFNFLEEEVIHLHTSIHPPDSDAEQYLLDQLSVVFSEEDNISLLTLPSEDQLKKVIESSNLDAALAQMGSLDFVTLIVGIFSKGLC